jgi:hypothetical protein
MIRLSSHVPVACLIAFGTHLVCAGVALGQDVDRPSQDRSERQERPDEGSLWASYGLAAGIGVLGFLAGGYAVIEATKDDCDEFECLDSAFYGAAIAGTIGVGIGSHLGNGRRGNVVLDILTAAGIWGVGIGPLFTTGDPNHAYGTIMFFTVPIAQVLVTTMVERAVGRSKARKRRDRLQAELLPVQTRDGAGLSLRLRF